MKYMLLVYAKKGAWKEDERKKAMAESVALCHELNASGRYLGASPLHPIDTAVNVRVREGKQLVIDGPFAETKEQLGGYFLIDVPSLEEAIEIAGRVPGARKGTVEIRPLRPIEIPVAASVTSDTRRAAST